MVCEYAAEQSIVAYDCVKKKSSAIRCQLFMIQSRICVFSAFLFRSFTSTDVQSDPVT